MTIDRRTIELWGGIECTINRVGNRYSDQLARVSAYELVDLVEEIASLGFRAVRWPALWERVAPNGLRHADWAWCTRTLHALRERGIEPIVGLVHHGSGPPDTNLLDPQFPSRLATYAAAFAERFPWVRYFTPINEPLTTARFSALYGHWYPHHAGDPSFLQALDTQVAGVVEAMRAIRRIIPDAQLVQTEDASSTQATRPLRAQAAFENARRWLSLDLLMGRVDDDHPLRPYLDRHGFTEARRAWFQEHAVSPDIIGLNYYVTSDRFLDHRLSRYATATHGGNGRQQYADVEAARGDAVTVRGHEAVLVEAWERYRVPVAITEAHLGCTREEQLRWLRDGWAGAHAARERGADVRAVTVWALLGSTDWDSLVTREAGHYEPGVFDLRGPRPRRTALATAAASLARTGAFTHPAAEGHGWWDRRASAVARRTPLLVLGASGTLGGAMLRACQRRGLEAIAVSRRDVNLLDPAAVRGLLAAHRPWALINAAGYVRVDEAERDARTCRQVNAVAPAVLAMACRKAGVSMVTFSSDLVFDGASASPYVEQDAIGPLNVYGRSKAEAEHRVLAIAPGALVIRTSAFFGPWDRANFVTQAVDRLAARQVLRAPCDVTVSPTYVPDLVNTTLDLLVDGAGGLWHLANGGAVSWFDLARLAARYAGVEPLTLEPCSNASLHLPAARPRYSVLGTSRGALMPDLEDALDRYVYQRADATNAA